MTCLFIATKKNTIFFGDMKKFSVSGIDGDLDIYSGHAPFLTFIKPGLLYVLTSDKKSVYLYVSFGILEVQPTIVNVLLDDAILGNKLCYDQLVKEKCIIETKIKNCNISHIKKLKLKLSIILAKLKVINSMILK